MKSKDLILTASLVVSIAINILLLYWGKEQVAIHMDNKKYWRSVDEVRRASIEFLGSLLLGKYSQTDLVNALKEKNRDYFEKEGEIVSNDLIFTFQDESIFKVTPEEYGEK